MSEDLDINGMDVRFMKTKGREKYEKVFSVSNFNCISNWSCYRALFPDFGMALRPVGDGFIRLIKMIVVPIVFSTIVIGAAGSSSMKQMGSLGLKTIIWFEIITTIVLGIGLLLVNLLKPGIGLDLSHLVKKDIGELSQYTDKVVDFKQMILNIIPTNIVDVMAKNDLLAVIFFAILFGVAASGVGKASEPAMKFLNPPLKLCLN